mmetsp:Transcript_98881/g.176161  ORF Transcript_98881/g.176161 Transcript_98881/m.176161 type:complete len:838 (-) Transcript_98881:47-2560(-)
MAEEEGQDSCDKVKICDIGGSGGLLLPLFGDAEQEWRPGLRAVLYLLGLLWLFAAVANVSDIFMSSIECITSKKKTILHHGTKKRHTVKVWNDTVANLTLMALGSSAPEIMLSIIELFRNEMYSGDLGPSTIVGSAAFNLFCISAVCIIAIPKGEIRKIKETGVYAITASCSLLAYLWLYLIVSVISVDVVEIWEGILTFLMFPVLILVAFAADKGYVLPVKDEGGDHKVMSSANLSAEELATLEADLKQENGMALTDQELAKLRGQDSKSKAHYRVSSGVTKLSRSRSSADSMATQGGAPRDMKNLQLSAVVPEPIPGTAPAPPIPTAILGFMAPNYAVLESAGIFKLPVVRKGDLSLPVDVDYKSRNGTAKAPDDFEAVEGRLHFSPGEDTQIVAIKIVDDGEPEDDEQFFVDLSNPSCGIEDAIASLDKCCSARIIIVDHDEPSILYSDHEQIEVLEDDCDKPVAITIRRKNGLKCAVTCRYRTEAHTATEGIDYEKAEGVLTFEPNQLSIEIKLKIRGKGLYEGKEEFHLVLSEATCMATFDPATDGGAEKCIITIAIIPQEVERGFMGATMRWLRLDWDKAAMGCTSWKEQFIDALHVSGGDEEDEPSSLDWTLHVITLPWKILFAIIPPTDFCGGWSCFHGSLLMIGFVTALIGDLASLVGCVMNMPDAITAISLVALGTSLPDTMASKAAAEQDPYADASVGNVTGSNSVNVFLGLGVPWTIGSIYWASVGRTAEWQVAYKNEASFASWDQDGGKFIVIGGDLGYSVAVFFGGAFVCLNTLYIRRKAFGGELGGPMIPRYITGVILVSLWFMYIGLSAVKSMETAAASTC